MIIILIDIINILLCDDVLIFTIVVILVIVTFENMNTIKSLDTFANFIIKFIDANGVAIVNLNKTTILKYFFSINRSNNVVRFKRYCIVFVKNARIALSVGGVYDVQPRIVFILIWSVTNVLSWSLSSCLPIEMFYYWDVKMIVFVHVIFVETN